VRFHKGLLKVSESVQEHNPFMGFKIDVP
jgi:hypothetical protein